MVTDIEERMIVIDDGTLDVVVLDTETDKEYRYSYQPDPHCQTNAESLYLTFEQRCLDDAYEQVLETEE